MSDNAWSVIAIIGAIFGVFIALGFPFFTCGGAKLADTSKTPECAQDIQKALSTFSDTMDMRYPIGPDDYKSIFNGGEIQKEYLRDGIHYTAYFHLDKSKTGCNLKFYKRGKLEPGKLETTLGNYGTLVLKKCQCK